ncbi:hypothetical protein [Mangrovimonas futianensis]|uniref:hypothetical protein n=1 Tax=Mangrovimonas futianensis TaxID=2895523 RepID=UPI001E3A9D81|nr:hypothetical protein [Mangrovimonas futianensis]MCF1422336.1 hypothetical protein [Mangrovimonas futianensis]
MNNLLRIPLLFTITFLLFACPSDDGDDACTKTIVIPQFYVSGNQTYYIDRTQEVPCDFPEPTNAVQIEPPALENFSYEVLSFVYTPDTGNNTSRLQFEIQLNNPNDYAVTGVPLVTLNIDGMISSSSYSNGTLDPCNEIDSDSYCILSVDLEASLDLGAPASVELVTVEYFLTN